MIRKFSLVDQYGQRYDMNDARKRCLYTDPSGLGYADSNRYIAVGSSFIKTKSVQSQQKITGTLCFGGKAPYENYEAFCQFIRQGGDLKLIYQSTTRGQYLRDVDIVSITKEEIENGTLDCKISMICKSLFYEEGSDVYKVSEVEGEIRYDIGFPGYYNDMAEREILLDNNGDVDAPIIAEVHGYCENPIITIEDIYEKEIGRIVIPAIVQQGEKILYSSLDNDIYVIHRKSTGDVDLSQDLDITNENFFKVPKGNHIVKFTSDTGAYMDSSITMYKYYRTV